MVEGPGVWRWYEDPFFGCASNGVSVCGQKYWDPPDSNEGTSNGLSNGKKKLSLKDELRQMRMAEAEGESSSSGSDTEDEE